LAQVDHPILVLNSTFMVITPVSVVFNTTFHINIGSLLLRRLDTNMVRLLGVFIVCLLPAYSLADTYEDEVDGSLYLLQANADVIIKKTSANADVIKALPQMEMSLVAEDLKLLTVEHAADSAKFSFDSEMLVEEWMACEIRVEQCPSCQAKAEALIRLETSAQTPMAQSLLAERGELKFNMNHHVKAFDGWQFPLMSTWGAIWMMRSDQVEIQARTTESSGEYDGIAIGQPTIDALAVSGPFMKGQRLVIESMNGHVKLNGRVVTGKKIFMGFHVLQVHQVQHDEEGLPYTDVDAFLPDDIRMKVRRYERHVNAKIYARRSSDVVKNIQGKCTSQIDWEKHVENEDMFFNEWNSLIQRTQTRIFRDTNEVDE